MAASLTTKPIPHLLSLPPEILQYIYLCSLSPSLPLASPKLGSILSVENCYRSTFLHAFWNYTPLLYHERWIQPVYKPGPHVRTLFAPLHVPVSGVETEDAQARERLQETVLRWRWFTFPNAKRWLEEAMRAVMKDQFSTCDLLSPDDQRCLNRSIATLSALRNWPSCAEHEFLTLTDGSYISLRYEFTSATDDVVTDHDSDSDSDEYFSPDIIVAPTNFLVIPSYILAGNPEWTDRKLDFLKTLSSYVNLNTATHQLKGFHEGMRNAISQGNYHALLTLLWLATRLAQRRNAWSGKGPFEPPEELFSLVARRGIRASSANADGYSDFETRKKGPPISARLFKLLLRANKNSMPTNDRDIEEWASQLLTYENSAVKAFAACVLDWSKMERCSEAFRTGVTRRPITRREFMLRPEKENELVERLRNIWRGGVPTFAQEMEEGGESQSDELSWE